MQGQLVSGRYRLADAIGSGGMGRVWRAHDEVLHRAVAIKELTAALYVSESELERLLARTRAEARAAARINHSAVVTVHDVLEHDGRPWIVMELVEGYSLADAVKERGRVEPTEAARIGLWVLRALRAAHSAGVLHRDVKPGNVLISAEDGRVLLTDFGIAQIEGDTTITRTGEVVGSVDYLAPERVRGHDPGPSSDLWALAATLYTAVEGRSPFRRTSPLSTMQAVVEEDATEPQHAGPLTPVIAALLRKDPATRPSPAEAEQMLAEAAEGRRPSEAQAFVPTQHTRYEPETRTGPEYIGGPAHTGATAHTGQPTPTGTPYPPMGGLATIGPPYDTTGTGTGTGTGAAPARTSRRRRLRTLALVVALAAVVGGGTAVLLQKWGPGSPGASASTTTTTPPPSPSATDDQGPEGGVPASWVRVEDPLGFSLYLPKGWKREVVGKEFDGLQQIDYTPDGGEHFVRIAVDTSPDFANAYDHMVDLEQQVGRRLVGYETVYLKKNLYRDREGSLWEYTWNAQAKDTAFPGPRRAIDQAYIDRDGTEYAIYMSAPESDWTAASEQFTAVLKGWQPNGS
ncbi:serine/threonine protein kinase [Streptomyces cyaneochromogenes]|uniref:non-specific serine/threonine protein kinase n=1 Tax=Streptomyces cyaneochromogenes TaxID=2496836 RepID=A0A3Q9EW45_9ACTN|nr:serine/threonine-protein kinase [Streptomyces cyaneochromogenes]AZQ36851.1 serine/threonine protein kinase [Streptomyces cyaneochromogenes]